MIKNFFSLDRDSIIFIVLLVWYIVSIQFYQYVGFQQAATYTHIAEIFALAMFFICFKDLTNTKRNGYVSYLTIGVMLSFLISMIFWGASPFLELQSQGTSVGLLYIIVYFVLRRWNAGYKSVETAIITFSIIYLLCWLYSLYRMPEMIFGFDRDDNYGEMTNRGFYRLFIPGNIISFLVFFFLGRFLREKKIWCLALAFAVFVVIILHVGRQQIVWTLIPAIIMIFMHYRKHLFYMILAAFIGYGALNYVATEIPAVSAMIEISDDQRDNFENDIRVDATKYFMNVYPHNVVTNVFGNGTPARNTEIYKMEHTARNKGFFMEDIGFFAMYCNYGIWGVVFSILLLCRVIKMEVEPKYNYLKYFIYCYYGMYLMSQALTSAYFVIMMAYYMLEKSASDLKNRNYMIDA